MISKNQFLSQFFERLK